MDMRYTKALLLSIFSALQVHFATGQVAIGAYSTENTIGMVKDNPSFALTDDRAQVNFAGAGVFAGGNYLLFNRNILSFLVNGDAQSGDGYIKNPTNADRSLSLNMELLGPGASFKILKKHTFAITTALRYLTNSDHLCNNLFLGMGANSVTDSLPKENFNISNYSFVTQMFKEINISYATCLRDNEDISFSAGATLKVLFGQGAMVAGIPQASFNTVNNDGIAYNLSGRANFAYTPYANTFALSNSPMNATQHTTNDPGVGLDIGAIYYVHINNTMKKKVGYQVRLAASITDIGGISYTAAPMSGNFTINNKDFNYKNVQNNNQTTFGNRIFNEYLLDTVVKAAGNISKFWVGLPTAFHLNADVNMSDERFYINGNVLLNLRSPSADNFVNHYITAFTLTPRYYVDKEREIGFALPFTFNVLNQGSLGAVAFVGPFYIGSGSFFNMFITDNFKSIDLYTGFALRIKQKRQKEKDYMMM